MKVLSHREQAGEITRAEGGGAVPRGAIHIIRQLGLVGLYKVGVVPQA